MTRGAEKPSRREKIADGGSGCLGGKPSVGLFKAVRMLFCTPPTPFENGFRLHVFIVFPQYLALLARKKGLGPFRSQQPKAGNPLRIQQQHGTFVYKDEPIQVVIEDPVLRDSRDSYLIQAADCAAFLLKQSIEPSSYMKQHGGNAYLRRLEPVFCKQASNKEPERLGIVRL